MPISSYRELSEKLAGVIDMKVVIDGFSVFTGDNKYFAAENNNNTKLIV